MSHPCTRAIPLTHPGAHPVVADIFDALMRLISATGVVGP